jgi:hypothetical protein
MELHNSNSVSDESHARVLARILLRSNTQASPQLQLASKIVDLADALHKNQIQWLSGCGLQTRNKDASFFWGISGGDQAQIGKVIPLETNSPLPPHARV